MYTCVNQLLLLIQEKLNYLLNCSVSAYNRDPEDWQTSIAICMRCCSAAWKHHLPFSMAPKYVYEKGRFEQGRLVALLKYGAAKAVPQERYRKPTKRQLSDEGWKRPWEAAQGILPKFIKLAPRRRPGPPP